MIVENDCLILQIFQMSDGETREEVPMNVMIHQQAEREAQRVQANREELVERIGRAMRFSREDLETYLADVCRSVPRRPRAELA